MSTKAGRRSSSRIRKAIAIRIVRALESDLERTGDPRATGKALVGEWTGFWRYRVGDYRAIARIEDGQITIFVIEVAHRRDIYR